MRFAKGHGAGNDFVILPDPDGELAPTGAWVAAICDRHRGIGADGMLRVVRAAKHPDAAAMAGDAEWFMDYRNADGSVAEMCGNGVRVFVRYLIDSGLQPWPPGGAGPAVLPVATRAGVVLVEVGVDALTVDLPVPRIGVPGTAVIGSRRFAGTAVSVGNPHLVCRAGDGSDLDALDLITAPGVDPRLFPRQANVEFLVDAEPLPGSTAHVRMRVYERGVGETLACGSGVCAAAAVVLRGTGQDHGVVTVDVPGGRLTVGCEPDRYRLTGPAVIVATGDLDPAAFGAPVPPPGDRPAIG